MKRRGELLILDACVLIDFCESDQSILALVSKHVGKIHVASPVFEEVGQLDESSARTLGIDVVEPDLEMLAAAARTRGRMSVQDRLCFLLAKANGWTCVSNDGALRRVCLAEGVELLWGLEMMGLAVEAGALPGDVAEAVARVIQESNPYVTEEIVAAFVARFVRKPGA
jgi:hypothetical protein